MADRHCVLIVDDDPDIRDLVAETLGSEEFDLLFASDGDEAVRQAQKYRPELIVLDVRMPGRDGCQVSELLNVDPKTAGTKIVMLSAHGTLRDRVRGREAGATAYWTKPFDPIRLRETVLVLVGEEPTRQDRAA